MKPTALILEIFFRRARWRLAILALSLLGCLLGLTNPFLQQIFIDHLIGSRQSGGMLEPLYHFELHPLWFLLFSFGTFVIGQAFYFGSSFLGTREAIEFQHYLSKRLYHKALELHHNRLVGRTGGDLVALYATDVASATIFLDQTLANGAAALFPIFLAPLALHYLLDLPMAAILLAILVVFALSTLFALRQSRFFTKFKQLASERIAVVNEWILNIRSLRILGWTEPFETKIRQKREEEVKNRIAMVTNGQSMTTISSTATFFINLVALYTLTRSKSHISAGQILSLLWILGVFLNRPFRQLPWFFTMSFDGWTSIKRICAFLSLSNARPKSLSNLKSEKSENQDATTRVEPNAKASLKVTSLNLINGGNPILKNIDLTIGAGEFLALVGEVGSGKSQLLLALMGETDATMATYQIGGTSVLGLPQEQLCQYFGYVPQEPFIMSATLSENVAFTYDATEFSTHDTAKIQNSLKAAHLNPEQEQFSQGLSTEIGERGVNLSGGQRQRLALARADYFDKPILLLDDPLSAIDVRVESFLTQELLLGRWKNKTRLLATHRHAILAKVDRILFLREGELLDQGSWNELMARSPQFREFVNALITSEQRSPRSEAPMAVKEFNP